MNLYLRGVAWFGLYVVLVLLPAGVAVPVDPFEAPRPAAVETSVALGLLAYTLVMIQFALVSHLGELTMRDRGDRRHVVLFYAAHDESRMVSSSN